MRLLWTYIDDKDWREEVKYKMMLLILGVLYALIGFAAWLLVRIWALSTRDWMVCFIGYPVIISWFVVFFYSCNHYFHNGKS